MLTINNLIRSINRMSKNIDKFNIATLCKNNEKYLGLLCQTDHNFYMVQNHVWNNLTEIQPSNIQSIDQCFEPIDYLICHDRAEQYDEARQIAKYLQVPIILIDMCSNTFIRPQHIFESIGVQDMSMLNRNPAIRVCMSEYIQNSWNLNSVSFNIPIGIDCEKLKNTNSDDRLIAIDNNTEERVGKEIAKRLKEYKLVPTDHHNLEDITVNKCGYFINTNKCITVKLLEAMAAGCIVICLRNPETDNYIEHTKTGMLVDNLDQLSDTIKWLESNSQARYEIITNAREKIVKDNSLKKFITQWNKVFKMMKPIFYSPSM